MDNSGSMADQQAMMASNIDLFVSTFTSFGLDYRIATVTTDVGNGGLFRGTVPVVTPDTPNPEVAFAENVVTGIFGSDFERGFDSAYLALSNSANPDFLRENAALVLVFVSDEPEQSILLGSQTSDYVEWFQSLKSSPAELMMSDITGGEIGCSGDAGDAGPGGRYPLASAATGGGSGSICDADWGATIQDLAVETSLLAGFFVLSNVPLPSSVEVMIEGAPATGWTFDEATNAVVFEQGAEPAEGVEVTVIYLSVDCP